MAKVYETRHARMCIPISRKDGKGCIMLRFDSPSKFIPGVLQLTESVCKEHGRTEKELVEIIENLPQFTEGKAGEHGIWRVEQRLNKQIEQSKLEMKNSLSKLPTEYIKAQLTEKKVEFGVGETHEQLAARLYVAMAGSDVDIPLDVVPQTQMAGSVKRGVQSKG
jgi:hypothetical protein